MGGEAEDQQSPLLRSCSSPEGPLERTDESGSLSGGLQGSSILTFLYVVYMSIKTVVFSNKLNSLIVFGPAAILVQKLTDKSAWVFFLSLVGITPLAKRLGYATEQLAFYTGPTVGGLLNATFGNAIELIISILAMKSGMIRVVQLSLLGSILSNLLLVLGCAFFYGGFVLHKEQLFNKTTAVVNSGLLFMAVMGLLFPTVLHYTHTKVYFGKSELALSRFSTCIMLVTYAAYLFFQLKNQRNLNVPLNEIPFSVVLGWIMGQPMDLNCQLFETATLFISVFVVALMLQEGTHYFKGLMLPLCYLIVAASFFVHVDVSPGVQLKFHLV
ncbi:vacuolar cation/proton exchanger 5-like isoform X4 [Quercus robur]|uniref:vacuolar cation/proton exchanger 5-like isoform X4 n=1 Tax=Quercus robur TaxID=38942 RepID=UPI0021622F13|nr:vacuolar cation/proton exchanger 5-like isoform X4 [Quercus robur]